MERPIMIDARRRRRGGFKPKLIAMSVAACLGVSAQQGLANPTGGTATSGGASFASSGNTLTVTNTANAIINWQSFSIGVNEITRFLQSSASSAVLNRVVGAGGVIPQSVIDGILSSNGRVFLLNSGGIVIGANARIDVAGFVASSLNLSDQDFLNGRMHFAEVPGAGNVSNAGVIQAASGGRVFLVAPNVENTGAISAPQGQIVLAAGRSVDLVSENSPFVTVRVTADTEQALNLGSLIAESGRIDMSGALVRNSGTIAANSAVLGANGEIRLVATNSVTLDAGSVTSASGGGQGGNIQVSAPVVTQVGDIRADGDAGGKIQIDANNFLQAGIISASGSAGAGGEIGVNAAHVIQTSAAVIAADGSGNGGSISVDASGALDGLLFSSARYSATGDKGGNIKLLGHDIVLLGASANASGTTGGGTILVGGDFHGSNPAVPNATTTGINFSTTLKADATQNGDGGKIVVWSDANTQFYGTASARGGAQSGNGGFMEISGRDSLTMGGFADAGAPNGTPGTLLLDPKNIIIDSNTGGSGTLGSFQLVDPHPGANENFGSQVVVLPNQNVVVTDPNDNFGAGLAGAVYLFDSTTGALLSALTGSSPGDHVGSGAITVLPSGNYLVQSPGWSNGSVIGAGAMTFGTFTSGVSGPVTISNSLVGTTANDAVGSGGITLLFINGNYVVSSPNWNGGAGAVTTGSGTTGVLGLVSAANSLVGTTAGDNVGSFGITPLSNGNYVVNSSNWSNGPATRAGAVTFVNSTTGLVGPVSATNSLVGTTTNDLVGSFGVTQLTNGNYVVNSANWGNGPATAAGAVTFGSGTTGVSGPVSTTNSLVGTTLNDQIGIFGVLELTNGNYLVLSPRWNNGLATLAGAVTFGSGTTGVSGPVSATNSLVGTTASDNVGASVTLLSNGNYVVTSPNWDIPAGAGPAVIDAGAVTFGSSTSGVSGAVSAGNSLVGSTANDGIGSFVTPLFLNGNYVVNSPNWNNVNASAPAAGAVTFVNGSNGFIGATGTPGGAISATNSLVGTTANDQIGSSGITQLFNGNYVVNSPSWSNGGVAQAGAVTFGSGTSGVSSPVSSANSLVGTTLNDRVGSGGVTLLFNGNYVVASPGWASSLGAVTFGNGTSGVSGPVSATNSLVGATGGDQIGSSGVTALINGNYVVASPFWSNDNGTTKAGAVTFGNGTNGISGTVSSTNSLIGTTDINTGFTSDFVGSGGVTALINGNYVVSSPLWGNGAFGVVNFGAVTWGNGTSGTFGKVSAANSLVGTAQNDQVGSGGVTPLFISGNYVVRSPNWNGGAGAVTFGSGTAGVVGSVSSGNSLVGSTLDNLTTGALGDRVGSGSIVELFSGNFLVVNPLWNNSATGASRAGAVTWVNGTNGNVFGQTSPGAVVSASNSLVGGTSNDQVGLFNCECNNRLTQLPDGNFVIVTSNWTNPATGANNAGAVTFGSGTAGIAGLISSTNSLVGSSLNDQIGSGGIFPLINGNFVVSSPNAANGALLNAGLVQVVTPGTGGTGGAPATGQTFASNPGGDVTITSATITAITNLGTTVVLQANNDITLNAGSDIVTAAGGAGGAITMQAGRSIVLNSSITTDNGALILVANESTANGVVDANRDAGAAVIAMAPGTTINAGSGNISLTLNNGAGLTNSASGDITLASLTTTGNVLVQNLGPTAGSGIVRADANQLITAGSAALDVNGAGGGEIGTPAAPIRVSLANLAARTQAGGAFFNSPTLGLILGGVTQGGLTGISASGNGNIDVSAAGAVSLTQGVSAGSGAVNLTAGGILSESAAGAISTTGTLTTSSVGGTTLNGANAVGAFKATNTASGNVAFTDAASTLAVAGISETGGGNVTLSNTGAVSIAGAVSAGAGTVTLGSGGNISSASGSVQGGAVVLTAAGAIGSPVALLEVETPSLVATAANGIAIDLNGLGPTPAVVNTLQNTTTGDIILNAHGGVTFTTLVSNANPGGNVSITTFSPLDVNAGINAGNSIFLATSGAPGTNDMFLNGTFTHGTSGAFEVTVGPRGQLTLPISAQPTVLTAAAFPNDPNITKFTFIPSDPDPSFSQGIVTGTNQSTKFDSDKGDSGESGKKDKDGDKKGPAVCK